MPLLISDVLSRCFIISMTDRRMACAEYKVVEGKVDIIIDVSISLKPRIQTLPNFPCISHPLVALQLLPV